MAEEGAPDRPEEVDDYHEPAWHQAPWVLVAIIAVLVVLALAFIYLRQARAGEALPGPPRNVRAAGPGTWKAYGQEKELRIIFRTGGRYELRTVENYSIVGPWWVTEEGQIAAEVDWREYYGIWYFTPVSADQMTVEVPELGYDLTFYKVN
jgi:hypothetical protein